MILLALECSAVSASVALMDDSRLLAESFVNVRLTHSQTLMPMVEGLLRCACMTLEQVDGFAVANGPGSFTGVRIGVAAVKGMAQALNRPCVGVSTLEAMAWQTADMLSGASGAGEEVLLCPVMDARCSQVYNALFALACGEGEASPEEPVSPMRRCADRAMSIEALAQELKFSKLCPYLVGDGAALCYNELKQSGIDCRLSPERMRYQRAVGVAMAARARFLAGAVQTAGELQPTYLRLPQAERDLKKRNLKKEA